MAQLNINGAWISFSGALAGCVLDSTNTVVIHPDSLPQAFTYDGSGNLTGVTVGPDANGNYYKQTISYSGTTITGTSAWVKQ